MIKKIDHRSIDNNTILGSTVCFNIGIYDETSDYPSYSQVVWNGKKYRNNTSVTGSSEGDLSNAPDVSSNWEDADGLITVTADYGSTESWIFRTMESNPVTDITISLPSSLANWEVGDIKFFQSLNTHTYNTVIDLNGHNLEGDTENVIIPPGGYLEIQYIGSSHLNVIRKKDIIKEFIPSDLTNLEFWLDANDTSQFTTSGNTITAVTEGSPNSHSSVSVSGTPQLQTAQINGKNSIYFDGNNDNINFGDVELHDNGVGRGLHIYVVANPNATGDVCIAKYTSSGDRREWYFRTGSTRIYENGDQSGNEATTYEDMIIGDYSIGELKWEAGNRSGFYLNGGFRQQSSNAVNDIEDTTSDLIVGTYNGLANDMNGLIAEICVFSRPLTAIEQNQMNEYFTNKYGIISHSGQFTPRSFQLGVARNGTVSIDEYLRREDGTDTKLAPFVVPFNCNLVAMSATTYGAETWTARIRRNGAIRYNLSISSADNRFSDNIIRSFSAGDKISFQAIIGSSGDLECPAITAWFAETK